VDRAAILEARRGKTIKYFANTDNSCAVEWDEEPPHDPDIEAVVVASQIAHLMNAKLVDEVHFMRKILIDGSTVTGFQRTALIATDGEIEGIKLPMICLEEDSARPVAEGFSLDRLGIPLVEVATEPSITSGEEAKLVARKLGTLFRMAKVRRGLGTIRQDLNVSIPEGARVEIKGVQDIEIIPTLVKLEVSRQKKLAALKKQFAAKLTSTREVTGAFKKTKSRVFKGKQVFAMAMRGSAGLFAEKLHARKHVGREIAEYVKSFDYGGFVHSDERHAPEELKKVMKTCDPCRQVRGCIQRLTSSHSECRTSARLRRRRKGWRSSSASCPSRSQRSFISVQNFISSKNLVVSRFLAWSLRSIFPHSAGKA
jgi:glutamyl-tRNA(Gln) amidotransferase subunit E